MKIGIFDSGFGGLLVTRALVEALPDYDYVYLGDTKRVPYGNHSQETVYEFTRQAVEWLFAQDCALVILACNTASAEALRRLQREYLPGLEGRVLGVIIPTAETAARAARVGVLATRSTVASQSYVRELKKLNPDLEVIQNAAPLLVSLIENEGREWAPLIVSHYLEPLLAAGIDHLVLGCTHYSAYKDLIRAQAPGVVVLCQDELIPGKLADYLDRHVEIETRLSRGAGRRYCLTELTSWGEDLGRAMSGSAIGFEKASL